MDSGFEIKYRKLFRTYYANLLFYAKRIVGDDDAEDVVQDVFVELWHRKKTKITDEQRRCVKMHTFSYHFCCDTKTDSICNINRIIKKSLTSKIS